MQSKIFLFSVLVFGFSFSVQGFECAQVVDGIQERLERVDLVKSLRIKFRRIDDSDLQDQSLQVYYRIADEIIHRDLKEPQKLILTFLIHEFSRPLHIGFLGEGSSSGKDLFYLEGSLSELTNRSFLEVLLHEGAHLYKKHYLIKNDKRRPEIRFFKEFEANYYAAGGHYEKALQWTVESYPDVTWQFEQTYPELRALAAKELFYKLQQLILDLGSKPLPLRESF